MRVRWSFQALRAFNYLVYAFLMLPIVVILLSSLTRTEYVVFPPQGLTFRWYEEILKHDEFIQSFWLSLRVALVVSALSTILGTLAAMALVRYRFYGRDMLQVLFLSPLMLPSVVIGVALLQYFTRLGLASTPLALILGHVIITSPYVVRLVMAGLAGFDRSLELAAMNLGASPRQAFFKITLPVVKSGVIAGGAFAFILSFDDLTVALFISGANMVTLPIRIYTYLDYAYDPIITAVSTVLILITAGLMIVIERALGVGRFFGEK